jgi:biotin operon repressor
MRYRRGEYHEGFSICSLLIAGMFFYWGIDAFLQGFWSFGFHWWIGFFWIVIGSAILGSQIAALANRSKLRNVVLQEFKANPEASIEEVASKTGISRRDIQAIILDLRANGQLVGKFSRKTGQMKPVPIEEETLETEKGKYCSNCGTPITKDEAQYCAYCGARI